MKRIESGVVVLGWVSFLTDIASEMIMPILPLFLANVLGAGMVSIGLIEGVADSMASLLKVGSGWFSDKIGKRKPLVVTGYSLSNFIKPTLALATSWGQVLGVRLIDRVGKGIRTSPRDVLISEYSKQKTRGVSFGFHRMMDTAGAVVGTSLAFILLSWMPGSYQTIFALSAIPGVMAVLVVTLLTKEREVGIAVEKIARMGIKARIFDRNFRYFLFLITIFALANISYAFFILRANGLGIAARLIPILYLIYNVVYATLAVPMGSLSDRLGRGEVLLVGFILTGLLLFGFAFATNPYHIWLLFALYGVSKAIVETVPRALVSDMVPTEVRGTALGAYHTCVGVTALPSGVLFGFLWQRYSPEAAFCFGAVVVLVASVMLLLRCHRFG